MRPLLCAIAVVFSGDFSLQAHTPNASMIVLNCPVRAQPQGKTDALIPALCHAVGKTLIEASNGAAKLRLVTQAMLPPAQPGEIHVTLHLDGLSLHSIQAHLEWQDVTISSSYIGQEVRLDTMDAVVTPRMYEQFVQGMIRVTLGLADALKGASEVK